MRKGLLAGLAAFVLTLALFSSSHAEDVVQKSFSTQLFEPALGPDVFFSVEGPAVGEHLAFTLGWEFNYQNKPLVLHFAKNVGSSQLHIGDPNVTTYDIIKHQATADLFGTFSFHIKWLHAQVGLDLPINYISGTDMDISTSTGEVTDTGESINPATIGDLRLQLKALIVPDWHGLSVAFSPILTFPTGTSWDFGGDPNVSFRPRAVVGYSWDKFMTAANVGWDFRQNSVYMGQEISDQMIFGLGVGYQVHPRVLLLAELFGRAGFSDKSRCTADTSTLDINCDDTSSSSLSSHPMETDVGGRINLTRSLEMNVGVGFGVLQAVGSPVFRILAGLRWSPDFKDTDHDGVPDAEDRCPTQPEDRDAFQDEDGCPDPDNDGDGIPDKFDDCPIAAEDFDGFKDDDGCPDPDNDADGVLDSKDKCPNEPETINGYKDDDGCPDKGESHVTIQENKIVITKKIFFDTNKATIKRVSNSILNEVALTLAAHPKIKGVRIEGHTDSRGNAQKNKDLSQRRAEAVRSYLVKRGVEPGRLFAIGYGPEKPIADNRTAKGREQNRRVEFFILEQAPGQAKPAAKSSN